MRPVIIRAVYPGVGQHPMAGRRFPAYAGRSNGPPASLNARRGPFMNHLNPAPANLRARNLTDRDHPFDP